MPVAMQGPVARAEAYQKKVQDHLGMFVHSERLERHGPFGLSPIDPNKPASEPSEAAIKQRNSMLKPAQEMLAYVLRMLVALALVHRKEHSHLRLDKR